MSGERTSPQRVRLSDIPLPPEVEPPPELRDSFEAYIRAVNVVASVGIGHPEWTDAQREQMVEKLYRQNLRADALRRRAAGGG